MTRFARAGFVAAAIIAVVELTVPAAAADLGGWGRGSIKDDHVAAPSPVSSCYYRADVGYSWSNAPNLRWTAWSGAQYPLVENVTKKNMDDTWTGGVGLGCGSGSRGFRYEAMLGYHGTRGIDGVTSPFNVGGTTVGGITTGGVTAARPIHSAVTTYTGMVNGYFDLGNVRGFVPYVGAGVGLAYHQMDEYSISTYGTGYPFKVSGASDLTLVWSVMAGLAYQVSDRAILDFGYRYIDFGRAATGRTDPLNASISKLSVDDMTAHEFKIGLRYHMGGSNACCQTAQYMPMK